jgi:hypothetical protein
MQTHTVPVGFDYDDIQSECATVQTFRHRSHRPGWPGPTAPPPPRPLPGPVPLAARPPSDRFAISCRPVRHTDNHR